MNPFGLRSAHVLGARSRLGRRRKTPPVAALSAALAPSDQAQLMIAGMFSVMPNLRRSPRRNDLCVQCNMNFFSSSRKVFGPL
jgi:hypothetical protein